MLVQRVSLDRRPEGRRRDHAVGSPPSREGPGRALSSLHRWVAAGAAVLAFAERVPLPARSRFRVRSLTDWRC